MNIELVKQKAKAGEQDTNTYHIQVKDTWIEMELSFDAVVNMPYQYWIEMHEFWAWNEEKLQAQDGDVIKRVLLSYANVIATWLLTKEYWSVCKNEDMDKWVNDMLTEMEGYISTPNFIVKNVYFDFDVELKITDFSVKEKSRGE